MMDAKLGVARNMAKDILEDIEEQRLPLSVSGLKAVRLAVLMEDQDSACRFTRYVGGATGVESAEELERTIEAGRAVLQGAYSSREPFRDKWAVRDMKSASRDLSSRRGAIHSFTSRVYYRAQFSGLVDSAFQRIRSSVDESIDRVVPGSAKKIVSAYVNLESTNEEDWSNAAHSCRRILKDLADVLFPPVKEPQTRGGKKVNLRKGNYVNRLTAFVEDSSGSGTSARVIGSHILHVWGRLDSLVGMAVKGAHDSVTREDAERCVIYTYLAVGDILSLLEDSQPS